MLSDYIHQENLINKVATQISKVVTFKSDTDIEETDNESNNKLLDIGIPYTEDFHYENIINPQQYISINEISYNNWNEEDIYKYANDAKYGDIIKQETIKDIRVRRGKDITYPNFNVEDKLLKEIKILWKEKLLDDVYVIPYKINIYQKGDFFLSHTDSPEKGLIGTVLIDLSKEFGKDFKLQETYWDPSIRNTLLFYSDLLHKVKPTTNNFRITLAFKIYKLNSINPFYGKNEYFKEIMVKQVSNIKQFGILLKYGYSYKGYSLKGIDNFILESVRDLGWQYKIVTVMVVESKLDYYDNGFNYELEQWNNKTIDSSSPLDSNEIKIYLLSENIMNDFNIQEWYDNVDYQLNKDIPFTILNTGYKWKYKIKNNLYVGNQWTGSSFTGLYLNKALIITTQE